MIDTGNIREITPMFAGDFKPSTGQKFQLAGLSQEVGQHFAKGEIGLTLAKLQEIESWLLKQIGVES